MLETLTVEFRERLKTRSQRRQNALLLIPVTTKLLTTYCVKILVRWAYEWLGTPLMLRDHLVLKGFSN